MKKIISLVLCVAMCCILLVGCAEDEVGSFIPEYEKLQPKPREAVELDFYIVTGDDTVSYSTAAVTRAINAYLSDKYNTTLDMHYLTASAYKAELATGIAASGADKADVILITDAALYDELYEAKKLVPLKNYFSSREFGKLNSPTVISQALLDATLQAEQVLDEKGNTVDTTNRYMVPNNRVVGDYEYYLINKAAARYFNFSELDIRNLKYDAVEASAEVTAYNQFVAAYTALAATLADQYTAPDLALPENLEEYASLMAELYADFKTDAVFADQSADANYAICDAYITSASANYEYFSSDYHVDYLNHQRYVAFRTAFEAAANTHAADLAAAGITDAPYLTHDDIGTEYVNRVEYLAKYECVASIPKVTRAEAFSSGYAIVAQDAALATADHYTRCIEVIYELNTEVYFKNLLQYGEINVHYTMPEDSDIATPVEGAANVVYSMNNSYTGNVFNSYYNELEGESRAWNEKLAFYGQLQNEEAVYVK